MNRSFEERTADKVPRLRRFGLVVSAGLTVVGSISWYRGHETVPLVLLTAAALLALLGLMYPPVLGPVERGWLAFGGLLGWINTRIILSLVFALVVTPVGVVMRLFRDPLDRKLKDKPTYWLPKNPGHADAKTYERQF